MRIMVKGSITTALGLLLCMSGAKAEELNTKLRVTSQSSANSIALSSPKNHQNQPLSDAIIFLDKKLTLAAKNHNNIAKQVNEQPNNSTTQEIINFLPTDSPLVGFISIKPEKWDNLTRFHLFHMAKQTIFKFMPPNLGFNYARDIQSWLGEEIVVAFMPKISNNPATMESSFVMVFPITNDMRVETFLDEVKKDKNKVKIREYQGATIFEIKTNTSAKPLPTKAIKQRVKSLPESLNKLKNRRQNNLAIATFPGYVVLGLDSKPLEQLIDTKNGKIANIRANSELQTLTQQHQAPGVLFSMYQNPVAYMSLVQDLIKDLAQDFPAEFSNTLPLLGLDNINLEQLKAYKSINSSLRLQPEGMRFQVQAYMAKSTTANQLKSAKKPVSKREQLMISRMPAATYSAITGSNINLYWQALSRGFESIPEVKKGLTEFRNFVRTTTGLDFDKDFIGWMDGEYGFFTFPTKGGLFKLFSPNANFGVGLIVKTNNRSVAENTLNKLEQLVKSSSNGEATIKNSDIKGKSVTSWNDRTGSFSPFAYSWIEQDTLLLTTGFGAITDLLPKPYVQLSDTYNFTTATNSLPYPNQGYFYVNMGSSLSWIYGLIPQEFQNNEFFNIFKQTIGSIYSVSATTSLTPETQQMDMLMVLAPTRQKK
ncbi:DUF3352 domain-containing protein [Calothrix sp. UHCC 0171]|uniref:DUF3352 domain-containing protein n=1 Tax=Calothrix sp. UHCC 0171 TaxID=3110245 RepID=UPI002B208955|nr:DUF3352 domain-containing protein [Calothrix sp. UHCC 0171]MEA5569745.1 DUF3352 domain-containing protein [Calothrix sp. UHCC 0171]